MKQRIKRIAMALLCILLITIPLLFVIDRAEEEKRSEQSKKNAKYDALLELSSEEDYIDFVESVNAGEDYHNYRIVLTDNLDFTSYESVAMAGSENVPFAGCFDGNGHKIHGMKIENPQGSAAMFGKLTGIVKNLQLEACEFSGKLAGSVAAECYDGAILNCCLDSSVYGDVAGSVVGKLRGNVLNCVASSDSFAGEISKGAVEHCYVIGDEITEELNQNLQYISGTYDDLDFYLWNQKEEKIFGDKADLLRSLTARIKVDGKELKLKAYYSVNDRRWCMVLPAASQKETLSIEARTASGGKEHFYRKDADETMIFTWKNILYPIDFLCAENIDTVYVTLEKQKTLADIHAEKTTEVPGVLMVMDTEGTCDYHMIKGFYGHGNDSWAVEKKSYNLKLDERADLLGLGENEDFSFLACYRDNSLMCYATTTELCKELGFPYSPDFRLVNLYVAGEYAGVYFLAEKVELDQNRIDISNVYEQSKAVNHNYMEGFSITEWKDDASLAARYAYKDEVDPEDLTGGYLLEADIVDYTPEESRFVSTRGIPMTMKRARYSSEAQVNYIADYWQEFEDALFAADGVNGLGRHYTEYIDLESFAMQWLIYELVQEGSMSSSIYFYKESEVTGDGLLHACFPWDMEHSYILSEKLQDIWNLTEKAETLYGYWAVFCQHEDFKQELRRVWEEKFLPAIDLMIAEEALETASGMKNLRWYEERIAGIDHLENSRWRKMYPLNRCQTNREFLKIRKEVISSWMAE